MTNGEWLQRLWTRFGDRGYGNDGGFVLGLIDILDGVRQEERERCAKIAEDFDWEAPGVSERMGGYGVSSEGYESGAAAIIADEIRRSSGQ